MPGIRQQLVAFAIAIAGAFACASIAAPAVAHAFHNGSVFDRAPGAGGGGGLFYTGSVRERGWDCTACHVESRGRLRVDVTSQPPELIADGRFVAGTAYAITIAMRDPQSQLGLASTRSNYNGIGVSVLDAGGGLAGTISGFDPSRFYARGASILASDSTVSNETSWTFTWTAPAAAPGPLTINLGVVDGNGAGVAGASTLTDPLGDDVAVHAFVVRDGAVARAAAAAAVAPPPPYGRSMWAPLVVALVIVRPRRWRGAAGGPARRTSRARARS